MATQPSPPSEEAVSPKWAHSVIRAIKYLVAAEAMGFIILVYSVWQITLATDAVNQAHKEQTAQACVITFVTLQGHREIINLRIGEVQSMLTSPSITPQYRSALENELVRLNAELDDVVNVRFGDECLRAIDEFRRQGLAN